MSQSSDRSSVQPSARQQAVWERISATKNGKLLMLHTQSSEGCSSAKFLLGRWWCWRGATRHQQLFIRDFLARDPPGLKSSSILTLMYINLYNIRRRLVATASSLYEVPNSTFTLEGSIMEGVNKKNTGSNKKLNINTIGCIVGITHYWQCQVHKYAIQQNGDGSIIEQCKLEILLYLKNGLCYFFNRFL